MKNRILLGLVLCFLAISRVSSSSIIDLYDDNKASEAVDKLSKLEEDLETTTVPVTEKTEESSKEEDNVLEEEEATTKPSVSEDSENATEKSKTIEEDETSTQVVNAGNLKGRPRRQGYMAPYQPPPPSYASPANENCPPLVPTCPKCLAQYNQHQQYDSTKQYDICSYPVVIKVLLLAKPYDGGDGRLCGKLGLLSAHGKTDVREFRRLLTFSLGQNCGCNLKPTSRYFLLSQYSGIYKEGALYSKISLSADVVLIPVDRYTEKEVERRLQECNPPAPPPYSKGVTYAPPPHFSLYQTRTPSNSILDVLMYKL